MYMYKKKYRIFTKIPVYHPPQPVHDTQYHIHVSSTVFDCKLYFTRQDLFRIL